MNYAGLVGSANALQSPMADGERLVNWYVEPSLSESGPTRASLLPTPGQQAFCEATGIGTRAIVEAVSRAFAVVGTVFGELSDQGVWTARGTVAQDSSPATISYNGGQLFITSGHNGYLFVLATNTLTTISDLLGAATMGAAKDGFFLCFDRTLGKVRISNLNDGATWDSTQYFTRSLASDPWQAMIVSNSEIWLIGEVTGEIWYNAGTYPIPFAPSAGAFFPWGTKAPFSVRQAGDMVVWLGNSDHGGGRMVGARGYTPKPISSYAVETAVAGYLRAGQGDDCETLVYEEAGHVFACFSFPSANATWCVDVESGLWHERGSYNSPEARYDVWHPRVHAQAFGKHLIGERGTGRISVMDLTYGLEADGSPIRRLRIGSPIWARNNQRLVVSRFEVYGDSGLGLATGQGVAPVAMLRSSWDTRTFGAQTQRSTGRIGEFSVRWVWTRPGSSLKAWMPEIVVSDPVPYRIDGADVVGTGMAS